MTWTPEPIDTAGVALEPEVSTLTDLLARNTHDLWARRRIEEGWKYGPRRNDEAREHPGLVPYEELPESEKEYDRLTALGALKAITALGYRIEPPSPDAHGPVDASFEERLLQELANPLRNDDFDMNDAPEIAIAECDPELAKALQWLSGTVGEEWRIADQQARNSQMLHRHLARVAISCGTAAVIFAILQLAAHVTKSSVKGIAGWLEIIAVVAAVFAVGVGVIARMNHRWLGHRHRAERLRMLKFSSLERLWSDDPAEWRERVKAELRRVPSAENFHIAEEWSEQGDIDDADARRAQRPGGHGLVWSVIGYYRVKRLAYQGRYFDARFRQYSKKTRPWQHVSLGVFFASMVCVLIHYLLEWGAHHLRAPFEHLAEDLALWFVALAAIIPVVGAGIRAWFGAFELTRSASLFKEKSRELQSTAEKLGKDASNLDAVRRHIRSTEQFLRQEHREWLRLLRDAEWFL